MTSPEGLNVSLVIFQGASTLSTAYHAQYWANLLNLKGTAGSLENLSRSIHERDPCQHHPSWSGRPGE